MPVTNIDITDVDHEARITANESSITTLNSSVSSLSSAVNNPTTGLSALNTTVSGHTMSIGTINTTLSSHTLSIDGLLIDVAQNTSDIGALQSDLNTLETTVSGHTTSIGTLTSDVSTLNSTVSGHTTAISGITTDISNIQTSLENVSLNTTGFENQVDSTYTFDEGTRTFTIQPATTNYNIFQDSVKSSITTSKSITIPDVTSPYFIYLDNTNTLQYLSSFDISLIENKVYVAVIYWNAVQGKALFVGNERHEASMSWATHYYLHTYEGSRYQSGFALSGFSIDGDGSSNTHSQFVADAGVFSDEDIIHNMIASPQIPILYRIGTEWRRKTADSYPFIGDGQEGFTGTGRICYNELVTGSYQLTEVSNNHHVLIHLLATNDINYPVIGILGINEYSPVSDAREGANVEISSLTGLPFTEFVLIGTVILQTSSSYTNTYKVRTVSTDLGENYVDFRTSTVLNISSGAGDHSLLSNLDKDTHLLYLTNARGDARYGSLTQTNTNTSDISTLNSTVSGHTTSIGTINTTLSTHTSEIGTLTSDLSTLTGVVGGHTTSISTLTSDLGALTTVVSGHTTSIGTINSTLTSLDGRITTLEGAGIASHASTHENGGADELALDASQITNGNLALARNSLLTKGSLITSDNTTPIELLVASDRGILSADSTSSNGLSYKYLCELYNPKDYIKFEDDFIGDGANWSVTTTGTSTGILLQNTSTQLHEGIVSLQTGNTSTGHTNITTNLQGFLLGNGLRFFECKVMFPVLSVTGQLYIARIGFGDQGGTVTTEHNQGVYWEYNSSNSLNFAYVSASFASRTRVLSATPVVANQWYRLGFLVNAGATEITFYINGVAQATTITTNITTTGLMGYNIDIRKTSGTTSRLIHVDFYRSFKLFTSRTP